VVVAIVTIVVKLAVAVALAVGVKVEEGVMKQEHALDILDARIPERGGILETIDAGA
jgi:hypothetical protein